MEGSRCSKYERSRDEVHLVIEFMLHVFGQDCSPGSAVFRSPSRWPKMTLLNVSTPIRRARSFLAEALYRSVSRAA